MTMGWQGLGILLAVSAALCAVGYRKYVYFMSVGYGLAVAGEGAAMLVMFAGHIRPVAAVCCALMICYGVRLSGFLIYREAKNAGYRGTMKEAESAGKKMNFGVMTAIWVSVSLLYVAQAAPVYYRLLGGAADIAVPAAGCVIAAAAIILEAEADREKSAQKKLAPGLPAMHGLYRIVRCPNYFAEILFWTGVLLMGVTALRGAGQWILALCGYVLIIFVMLSGAHRLDKRQALRYGGSPEYLAYAAKTPILIPFVPLYHI
jgi:steroid 5-alpha reductase family enzyme